MQKLYKRIFALTDHGARDVTRATWICFLVYCANMIPAFLLVFFSSEILSKQGLTHQALYIGIALATSLLIYFLLPLEYDALYSTTYQESANLRIDLAETLSKLPLSYFSKHDLSDISQTIMEDIAGIEHALSHSIPKVGGFLIFFPLIAIMMLIGNWKLALAVILPTIFSFAFIVLSKKVQTKGHLRYYQNLRENSEAFQEAIELQQEMKSFNRVQALRKDLYQKMEESEKIHFQSEKNLMLFLGISMLIGFIILAVVILVGIQLLNSGAINFMYFLGYFIAAIKIKDIVDVSKEGILEIFYLDPKIKRIREIRNTPIQEGYQTPLEHFDITLKHVGFRYDEHSPILKDVSFVAKQGEVTALVGASGCGKTTLLRLISRLYDYDQGEILIDGKDIRKIDTDVLFSKVSIVFQEVTLFNTTALENIRIGRAGATDEEVKEAAKMAHCHEFIEKMENGYDTLIGENGAELSGGERQRISIARAFLKNAPILILDEIAASLDVENESKIQESLNELIKNKTVIIISHRLKSIENVDKIVVLDKGYVESQGNHESLMKTSAIYQNLIKKTKKAESFIY